MEAVVGQQYLALRQELQEAEQEHTQTIRQEARRSAEGTGAEYAEELQYHQTRTAHSQAFLAAERRHHNDALEEQAARWQNALDLVTQGVEEMHIKAQWHVC